MSHRAQQVGALIRKMEEIERENFVLRIRLDSFEEEDSNLDLDGRNDLIGDLKESEILSTRKNMKFSQKNEMEILIKKKKYNEDQKVIKDNYYCNLI